MSFLVIIRGPLGVGKSTIAKLVASKIKAIHFSIDDVLSKNGLDQTDEKEGCIPLANFLKVNKIILPQLKKAIRSGTSGVVDGNFYHQSQIDDLIKKLPLQSFVFTLTAPLEVCIQRDLQRPKSYGKVAAAAVYNLVSRFSCGQTIDTSLLSVDDTVNLVISNLKEPIVYQC